MKKITMFLVLGLASVCCLAQSPTETGKPPEAKTKATYLVIYRPGPAWLGKIGHGTAAERARKVHVRPLR